MIRTKRVYATPSRDDGYRILVDRLWPRGLSKARAKVDLWLKDIAPSTELRKWFAHDPEKWAEFKRRYAAELKKHGDQMAIVKEHAAHGTVTLLFGARDEEHNEAIVLQQALSRKP